VLPSPWKVVVNDRARYVNREAPFGPSHAKLGGVRTAKQVRFGAKGLGDLQEIDILSGPPGPAGVFSIFSYLNEADGIVRRFCTRWTHDLGSTIRYVEIDGGLGRKLFLEGGLAWPCTQIPGGGTTSTSTSIPTTTSSSVSTTTSSSVSTTTSSSTTSSTLAGLCGNGVINPGENCDDGNQSSNDGCPSNCFIAACTPVAGTSRPVTVSFTPPQGIGIAALSLLLDYPEAKVFMPPPGPQATIGAANFTPIYPQSEVLTRAADLAPAGSTGSGHAVRGIMVDDSAVPSGPIFTLTFQECSGATPPTSGEFPCTVLDASDAAQNVVSGVTCFVTLP
jgi:cysteine-rich repeat protein